MSFLSKLRPHLSNGFYPEPLSISPISSKPLNLNWVFFNSTPTAKESEPEEEELEMIDRRKLPADYVPSNFDPTEHQSPPTDRVFSLVDEVSDLRMAGAKGPGAAKEEKKPGKMMFELRLEGYDAPSKIKVIKEVRSFTDLGLKEAKDFVKTPAVIKSGVSKEEGEQIIEKLKALGAKVVLE
ncbi:hypothetical protein AAC387_Pa07g3185 [Persea americana]